MEFSRRRKDNDDADLLFLFRRGLTSAPFCASIFLTTVKAPSLTAAKISAFEILGFSPFRASATARRSASRIACFSAVERKSSRKLPNVEPSEASRSFL